ncbi:DUF5403 family protein [Microbacterium lacus]|uniref:DUF5403 family protein n=1 Tax=Microbacterium lacus TaxID=415217 RepID=UPI000C2C7739|nr:DUF5403 family protein [Microbacterium lacus]
MASAFVNQNVRVVTAQIAGESQSMDTAAGRILLTAKSLAAQHRDTGNYMDKLRVVDVPGESGTGRTVKDRLVVADDAAAASIEWGHIVRFPGQRRAKFVPGQHIMRRALAATGMR